MKIIFLITPQSRAVVQISLREMCWNHWEALALFTLWHSVSALMLKTVYIIGFNKYVNQVHISLGMQMSLMSKDKLQNKQTKADEMLNSLYRWKGSGLEMLGWNPCSPGAVPSAQLWQIQCSLARMAARQLAHKEEGKSLVLLFVALLRAERIELPWLHSLTRAQNLSKGPQLSETLFVLQ